MISPRPLTRGDVLLVNFPFTDLTDRKVRPAVVVGRVRGSDVIVAFITSQITLRPTDAEIVLTPSDPEFTSTGLRAPSLIRLSVIETLHRGLVVSRIGRVGPDTQRAIAVCIRQVFEV